MYLSSMILWDHQQPRRMGHAFVKLSNGDWIEIFATESADRECWRLFQYAHDTEDLIVNSGTGVQREGVPEE